MVYTPQRRHAVASLGNTIQVLSVLQHFYTPNILILVSRLLGQAQATAAPYVHPTRSLFILFFMITAIHAASVLLHFLDFWSEMNGTKGIILDFIGQAHPASLLRILLLDCGIYLLQVISLVISYITNHSSNLPKSSFFPDGDLLLPPLQSASSITTDNDEDVASSGVRRRKGKGKASVEDEESSLWLDEDEDVDRSQPLSSTTALLGTGSERYHRREPPIIASLPLPYLINLICRLPAPVGPPPLTSGGTPLASPAPTPVAEVPPLLNIPRPPRSPRSPRPDRSGELPHSPRHSGLTSEWEAEEEGDIETGGRNVRRGAAGSMPDTPGRIPGDYWASIPTTDR